MIAEGEDDRRHTTDDGRLPRTARGTKDGRRAKDDGRRRKTAVRDEGQAAFPGEGSGVIPAKGEFNDYHTAVMDDEYGAKLLILVRPYPF